MRPLGNGGYQNSCAPGCGCDDDLDLEESGSFFMPESDQEVDCGDQDI